MGMDPNFYANLALYSIVTIWFAILLWFFLKRADREPIRSRSPRASIAGAVFVYLIALFNLVRASGLRIPCGFTDLAYMTLWSLAMASYFFRVMTLMYTFTKHQRIMNRVKELQAKKVTKINSYNVDRGLFGSMESKSKPTLKKSASMILGKKSSDKAARRGRRGDGSSGASVVDDDDDSSEYQRRLQRRNLYNRNPWRNLVYYAAFKSIFAVLVVIAASVDSLGQSWTADRHDCRTWGSALTILADAMLIVYYVNLLKKSDVKDPFLIITELRYTTYLGFCTIGIWLVVTLVGFADVMSETDSIFARLYVIIAFVACAVTMLLGFPLRYTYLGALDPNAKVQEADFNKFLFKYRNEFFDFLISEWSSENLLFLEDCDEFLGKLEKIKGLRIKDSKDAEEAENNAVRDAWKLAQRIFALYLDPDDAEYQVNISSAVATPLLHFYRTKGKDRRTISRSRASRQIDTGVMKGVNEVALSQTTFRKRAEESKEADDMNFHRLEKLKGPLVSARTAIYMLMKRDSYKRFCATNVGKRVLREMQVLNYGQKDEKKTEKKTASRRTSVAT